MKLHGVINASPDSLALFSIAETVEEARARAELLIDEGCVGIDLGGAGSTPHADRIELEEEWARLDGKIQTIAELGVELSVDTWQPEIMERALDAGANFMNAADGLQNPDMVALAADRGVPVVLPFLSGIDPKAMSFVEGDPMEVMLPWFEKTLARITTAGVAESQIIVDPGTGFGPADWHGRIVAPTSIRSIHNSTDSASLECLSIWRCHGSSTEVALNCSTRCCELLRLRSHPFTRLHPPTPPRTGAPLVTPWGLTQPAGSDPGG